MKTGPGPRKLFKIGNTKLKIDLFEERGAEAQLLEVREVFPPPPPPPREVWRIFSGG